MSKELKVNLTLLKRLVSELDVALQAAEAVKEGEGTESLHDYVVEMSKCAGLAAGVMAESSMLVGDIQHVIQHAQGPASKGDALSKLLGSLKGGGGLSGTN